MADQTKGASAKVLNNDCRPTIEVLVEPGIPMKELFATTDWLVDIARKLGPRGCEFCISGRDFLIRERFEEIVNVALPGRG